MAENARWGGDFEMSVLAHLLRTPVYSFQGDGGCLAHGIDRQFQPNTSAPSMYIILLNNHFEVVTVVMETL